MRRSRWENTVDMDESPEIALLEAPPISAEPTDYDWAHRICYLRLLDADAEGAEWREVARTVMQLDPDENPDRVHAVWHNHLVRAKWMTTHGYQAYLGASTGSNRTHAG